MPVGVFGVVVVEQPVGSKRFIHPISDGVTKFGLGHSSVQGQCGNDVNIIHAGFGRHIEHRLDDSLANIRPTHWRQRQGDVVEGNGEFHAWRQQCWQGIVVDRIIQRVILMGRLSPLDGIGAKQLHLDRLLKRVQQHPCEVILATNFTVEGDATAHYLATLLQSQGVKVSRIARGLPVGGELEQVDSGTLAQAVLERRELTV